MSAINVKNCISWLKIAKSIDNNWSSTYIFDKTIYIRKLEIHAIMRRNDGLMGRFGAGWNFKFGIQASSWRSFLISLFAMEISFYLPKSN